MPKVWMGQRVFYRVKEDALVSEFVYTGKGGGKTSKIIIEIGNKLLEQEEIIAEKDNKLGKALNEIQDLRAKLEAAEARNRKIIDLNERILNAGIDDIDSYLKIEQDRDNLQALLDAMEKTLVEKQEQLNTYIDKAHGYLEERNNLQEQLVEYVKTHSFSDETVKMMENDLQAQVNDLIGNGHIGAKEVLTTQAKMIRDYEAQVGVLRGALEEAEKDKEELRILVNNVRNEDVRFARRYQRLVKRRFNNLHAANVAMEIALEEYFRWRNACGVDDKIREELAKHLTLVDGLATKALSTTPEQAGERVQYLVTVATDVLSWLKKNNFADTGHGKSLADALLKYQGGSEDELLLKERGVNGNMGK